MTNMSYCRFRNTYNDLRDCHEHLGNTLRDQEEREARTGILKLCATMLSDFGVDIDLHSVDKEIDELVLATVAMEDDEDEEEDD